MCIAMRSWIPTGTLAGLGVGLLVACHSPAGHEDTADVPAAPPALERRVMVQDGAALGVGRRVELPAMVTLAGKRLTAAEVLKGGKVLVVSMTSIGCPLSGMYAPRLVELEEVYADRGVVFVYVNVVDAETPEEMRSQVDKFGFRGPYLPDRDRAVSSVLGARTTTEVFVLDAAQTLTYRGAVDDQYGVARVLEVPSRHFLKDAIDATLAGTPPRVEATYAPGCLVDRPDAGKAAAGLHSGVTFSGRIARILEASCVECHRPTGAAPFSLVGMDSVKGRAAMIEAVVRDGLMPPSHGVIVGKGSAPLAHAPELSAADREDLVAWLRAGMPPGEKTEAPAGRTRNEGWEIGQPDMKLMLPRFDVPASGPVRHTRLYVQTENSTDVWLTAMELRTMRPEPVQSALVWLMKPGEGAAGTLPGDEAMPRGLELLGVYSPGRGLVRYGEGAARRLPARALLLVDVYAKPMGIEMKGMLAIGMKFIGARRDTTGAPDMNAKVPRVEPRPERQVRSITIAEQEIDISPGEARSVHTASVKLDAPAQVLAVTPYMRLRGRSMTVDAELPDGKRLRLLDAERYDGRWAIRYELAEPMELPAGTRIVVRGVHDNSAANASNPDPTARVRGGARVWDEAMMAVVEVDELLPTGKRE
ncbi:MAG: redoxin family protein [Phycisphaerales bacterium]